MAHTNTELVKFAREVYAREWVYWYGTCGYKCDKDLYLSKKKQYPKYYTEARESGYMADIAAGKTCCDCVGLIKAFFWKDGDIDAPTKRDGDGKRTGCPDTSANGMIELCRETGQISSIPDIPGLVVWRSGHIGIYIGGGHTIEARGFAYDIQLRKLSDGTWTKWGKLPFMEYVSSESGEKTQIHLGDRLLKKGARGDDVQELQEALIYLGFDLGSYGADGVFGSITEKAVRELQKAAQITVDGVVGKATIKAIEIKTAEKLDSEKDGAVLPGENAAAEDDPTGEDAGEGEQGVEEEAYYNAVFKRLTISQIKAIAESYGVAYDLLEANE